MLPSVLKYLIKIYIPLGFLPDGNTEYTSGDTRIFSQLHPPLLINEHRYPFGIKSPKFQCFFNSVLQLIFSIFRNNSYTSPFNSSTEGTLLKCRFHTAHNARNSKDVDAAKFQLVRRDTLYNGQNQQDSTECLLMLIYIIHKGSMPDSSSTTYLVGLLYLTSCFYLFWKYILSAMYADWGPPHLSLVVCYIFHLLIPLLCKTWFYNDCNRNCNNPVLDVIKTLDTSNQAIYYNLQNIYFSSLIDLDI